MRFGHKSWGAAQFEETSRPLTSVVSVFEVSLTRLDHEQRERDQISGPFIRSVNV
jgi:hypothetical protein